MNVVVLRLLSIMAKAYASQHMQVTAFGLENPTKSLGLENHSNHLKIIPWNFRVSRSLWQQFSDYSKLATIINEEKPEIIHVNALQDLLPTFIIVRCFLHFKPMPAIIAMAHNPLIWNNPIKTWFSVKFIQYFADGFICLSTALKDRLIQMGCSDQKIAVIPNPYDEEQLKLRDVLFSEHGGKRIGSGRIIYIANIFERKGQDVFIRAASIVLKKYPDTVFDMIGFVGTGAQSYAEKIEKLIIDLGIEKNVKLLGSVPYEDIMKILKDSDIFAYPSLVEMMPRGVIEAMLAGKPVIASGVDGILDLIENGKTGILIKPGDDIQLAAEICNFIENPKKANDLALAGQSFVLNYCSPENVGHLHKLFYQNVLEGK